LVALAAKSLPACCRGLPRKTLVRWRNACEPRSKPRKFTASVSIGIAVSDDAGVDLSGVLRAADRALYRAKALGRDRAETAERLGEPLSGKQRRISSPAVR
jgi:GGDEF domain-containing protein